MKGLLHVSGRTYSHEDIIANAFPSESELATKVLSFCRAWLTGQSEFHLHTSGSTGPPKAIRIRREAMAASAALTQQALGLTADMHALVCLDTGLIAGQMMLVRGLEVGMTLHVEPPTANPFTQLPGSVHIDFAALVPYQLEAILQTDTRIRFESMQVAIIGGAPLRDALTEQLNPYACRFFATYGMTETVSHIALRSLNGPNRKPWFRVLPGITFETDSRGCLVINAPYLAEAVVTNDLIRTIDSDQFEWLGRWDHVINSGGKKIHPEVVEKKLAAVIAAIDPRIRFFIASQPHPQLYQQVVLVVESEATETLLDRMTDIGNLLDQYEVPRQILGVPRFAETASGKIDRLATMKSISQPLP